MSAYDDEDDFDAIDLDTVVAPAWAADHPVVGCVAVVGIGQVIDEIEFLVAGLARLAIGSHAGQVRGYGFVGVVPEAWVTHYDHRLMSRLLRCARRLERRLREGDRLPVASCPADDLLVRTALDWGATTADRHDYQPWLTEIVGAAMAERPGDADSIGDLRRDMARWVWARRAMGWLTPGRSPADAFDPEPHGGGAHPYHPSRWFNAYPVPGDQWTVGRRERASETLAVIAALAAQPIASPHDYAQIIEEIEMTLAARDRPDDLDLSVFHVDGVEAVYASGLWATYLQGSQRRPARVEVVVVGNPPDGQWTVVDIARRLGDATGALIDAAVVPDVATAQRYADVLVEIPRPPDESAR